MNKIHTVVEYLLDKNYNFWILLYSLYKNKCHPKLTKASRLIFLEARTHSTELFLAIFAFSTLLLSFDKMNSREVYISHEKEYQEAQQMNLELSKELRKYYLMEQDLIDAGASAEQAQTMIKSSELLEDSNLARDQLGK